MAFTYEDQVQYTKLALALLELERGSAENIETIRAFGELIKKYADEYNGVIYDATEYVYEQLRLLRGEAGAYDDAEMRKSLEVSINNL